MTAVPASQGTGVELICDGCGTITASDGCGLHDAEVVYVAVAAQGWTGTAFARGPHRCPDCSAAQDAVPAARTPSASRAQSTDRVSLRLDRSAAVVRVRGEIDSDVADELLAALESAAAARLSVIVDLTAAGTIDPVGLGTLVRGRNAARRRGGELMLVGPSRFLQTVLRTMRLHTAFPVFRTIGQAVAAVRAPGEAAGPSAAQPNHAGC